jgi:hypothetical protein
MVELYRYLIYKKAGQVPRKEFKMNPIPANDIEAVKAFTMDDHSMAVLGEAFWNLVKHYDLNRSETAIILGIKDNRNRVKDLEKKKAIPDDPDKVQRVGNLVAIHKNLRIIFPHNRDIVYAWMKTPSPLFGDISPIEYIKQDPVNSLPRIFKIRRTLDQIRCGA